MRLKQVSIRPEVWLKLRRAALDQATTARAIAERAILKELDGKPKKTA